MKRLPSPLQTVLYSLFHCVQKSALVSKRNFPLLMDSLSDWTTSGLEAQTSVWTNWSRGRIMGATLTLSRQNGNLLIAFTAFFVGLVSSRFWRIACFLLHRCYSTPGANDVLHHQQQIVLRNSPNPESGLWTFGQLAWAWRHSARRGLVRTLAGLVASLAAFAVASGFSSHISTGISDEVLIKTANCGYVNISAAVQVSCSDAKVVLYFLSGNGIEYTDRNDTPWYRVTVPGVPFGAGSTNETRFTYRPEEAASPMGCTEQFQFCKVDS